MGRFSGPELLFWVSFWESHYFYGSIFGAIIFMGLFLSGHYFFGSNLHPDDLFLLVEAEISLFLWVSFWSKLFLWVVFCSANYFFRYG